MTTLKAPFPWFGGKSRVADVVWDRFGDVSNYIEPFAGSLAVMLARPSWHGGKIETVNDLDGFIANFWRALAHDPEGVAAAADWPINETDKHARHLWLVERRADLEARLAADPEYYDSRIAGYWVWGVAIWIGGGFCSGEGPWKNVDGKLAKVKGGSDDGIEKRRPDIAPGGKGVHATAIQKKRPQLTHGLGVHKKIPQLSAGGGGGIHRQLPDLGSRGIGNGRTDIDDRLAFMVDWFGQLSDRLREVRVCAGDWTRILSPAVLQNGMTGVFFDPPYGETSDRSDVYAKESGSVAADVRAWCLEHGADPMLRIALCGYAGEGHEALVEAGWTEHAWRAQGGYGGGMKGKGETNRHRERIWFSPACLSKEVGLLDLLEEAQ